MEHGKLPPTFELDTLTSIYGAAISPENWNDVIDRCATDIGACGGAFLTYDIHNQSNYSISALGKVLRDKAKQDANILKEFVTEISPLEILAHANMRNSPAQTIYNENDVWPLTCTDVAIKHYKWCKDNLNIGPKLIARLNDNPCIHDAFVMHFIEGQSVPTHAHPTMTSLLPHIAKSAEMSIIYNQLQRRYAAILTMLDKVGIGLCVLDSQNRVIISNTEAYRIFDDNHGLKLNTKAQLTCSNPADTAQLTNTINAAQLSQGFVRAEALLTLRATPSADPLLVEVSPLRDTLDELNSGLDGVLVQLVDTGSRSNCAVDSFAKAYALSKAEKTVTEYLLDGLTNREIAEERGTKAETVKSQVSNIMQKTNTTSRVELVRQVLKTQPPIIG